MTKVTLFVSVSLDGFFEGPKKEIDWHMVGAGRGQGAQGPARGDLVVGGGDLGAAFMRQDLIDYERLRPRGGS